MKKRLKPWNRLTKAIVCPVVILFLVVGAIGCGALSAAIPAGIVLLILHCAYHLI